MNFLLSLWNLLPLLDLVVEPRFTPTPTAVLDQVVTPAPTTAPDSSLSGLLLILLVIFLAFVGCLIWSALKKKK